MNIQKTYDILNLSFNNKTHINIIKRLSETCEDIYFEENYKCSSIVTYPPLYEENEGAPDNLFIALQNNKVIGVIETSFMKNKDGKIDGIWIRIISTQFKKYKGIGTFLIENLIQYANNTQIDFIWVYWGGGNAMDFYLKKGFKIIDSDAAVLKINKYPDMSRIKYFEKSISSD